MTFLQRCNQAIQDRRKRNALLVAWLLYMALLYGFGERGWSLIVGATYAVFSVWIFARAVAL